jgi:membrane-bound metal-dependent hydrolase YbcI (DUF457 family)
MDNITHTLFALTLARTPLGRGGRGTTAALVLASSAPDIDIVATAGGAVDYLRWHRGPTHGLLGVVPLGLAVAGLVWVGGRAFARDRAAKAASFRWLVAVSTIGVLLHLLMDLPTSYGTRLLSPVDWRWFSEDWMPIIDIYLLLTLGAGLLLGRASPRARGRSAVIALTLMGGNYAVRAVAHHEALTVAARELGSAASGLCNTALVDRVVERWPRGPIPSASGGGPAPADQFAGACPGELAALPSFVSPLRWRLVARLPNAYEIRDVDLLASGLRGSAGAADPAPRLSIRYPNVWTPAVFAAARTDPARVFLGFARFPSARSSVDETGETTVHWTDMRFVGGLVSLDRPVRPADMFAVLVRLDREGRVIQARLGP